MKIKIAILDADEKYIRRILSAFNTKYSDKLETRTFSKSEIALAAVSDARIDVLIADESFEIDTSLLPSDCCFAYFVSTSGIDAVKGVKAICKYQKAESIYKQILDIYSEKAAGITGKKNFHADIKTSLFTAFSGGTGASTIAAAFAVRLASEQKKVLYLNMERMGNSEIFFKGDGTATFSDVLYAIKSGKANVTLKLESSVRSSREGVDFFAAPKMALDMMEMKDDDAKVLLNAVYQSGIYQYVVIDTDCVFENLGRIMWNSADEVFLVSDGSEIANSKLERAYQSLVVLNQQKRNDYSLDKSRLIYNKFSNKTSRTIDGIGIPALGGFPRYSHATTDQIVNEIVSAGFWNDIIR